jgi:hypothetical protein
MEGPPGGSEVGEDNQSVESSVGARFVSKPTVLIEQRRYFPFAIDKA